MLNHTSHFFRSSHWWCSIKTGVLKIFPNAQKNTCPGVSFFNKATGLQLATLLKKRLRPRCFPVSFVKFLRVCSTNNFLFSYFLRIPKAWSMLHHGLVGREFKVNNTTLCLHAISWHFLLLFIKTFVFLSFSFLFLMKYQIPQQSNNQSENGIGDKLSMESYIRTILSQNTFGRLFLFFNFLNYCRETGESIWICFRNAKQCQRFIKQL